MNKKTKNSVKIVAVATGLMIAASASANVGLQSQSRVQTSQSSHSSLMLSKANKTITALAPSSKDNFNINAGVWMFMMPQVDMQFRVNHKWSAGMSVAYVFDFGNLIIAGVSGHNTGNFFIFGANAHYALTGDVMGSGWYLKPSIGYGVGIGADKGYNLDPTDYILGLNVGYQKTFSNHITISTAVGGLAIYRDNSVFSGEKSSTGIAPQLSFNLGYNF
jgi:hypothetical protein